MIEAPEYDPKRKPECYDGGYANIWWRCMHFRNEGDMHGGHAHSFPHATVVVRGGLRVFVREGDAWTFKGDYKVEILPLIVVIEAKALHYLVALSADTVAMCQHAQRTGPDMNDILPVEMTIAGSLTPEELPRVYPLVDFEINRRARAGLFDQH